MCSWSGARPPAALADHIPRGREIGYIFAQLPAKRDEQKSSRESG